MKKRVIGGTIFAVSTYITLLLNLYIIMITIFLIVGSIELYKIYKTNNKMSSYFIFYIILFFLGLLFLNYMDMSPAFGSKYIIILVTMIMLADTFAYFVGKKFGKNKITVISPNKTYEGLIGSIILTLLVFILYIFVIDKHYNITIFSDLNIITSISIGFLTIFSSFIGDLLESKLKRDYLIKDSGTIIYGHGGILDRIDSLILGSIVYCLFLSLFIF